MVHGTVVHTTKKNEKHTYTHDKKTFTIQIEALEKKEKHTTPAETWKWWSCVYRATLHINIIFDDNFRCYCLVSVFCRKTCTWKREYLPIFNCFFFIIVTIVVALCEYRKYEFCVLFCLSLAAIRNHIYSVFVTMALFLRAKFSIEHKSKIVFPSLHCVCVCWNHYRFHFVCAFCAARALCECICDLSCAKRIEEKKVQ